ncbi:MAG: hypothetical protein GXO27_03010 [Chlorobi bacterium]|nr:hypothetical protein [Chlorobiota bacterium]
MKTKLLLLAWVIMPAWMFAQNGFHYKFLLTDASGSALANAPVNVKFTLKDSTATVVWEEEHTGLITDAHGIGQCAMGEGTRLSGTAATFDDIDWSAGITYDVYMDTGSGYTPYVTDLPFRFVPLAKYAASADYNGLLNKPEVFYQSGTTEPATDAAQRIYRLGSISVGTDYTDDNVKFYVFNDASGVQYGAGVKLETASGDPGNKTGLSTRITGDGSGYLLNQYNEITSNGTGTQVNFRNAILGDGSGTRVNLFNYIGGDGSGYHAGEYTLLEGNGDNYHIGNYVHLRGNGNGTHVGFNAALQGTGSGDKYGVSVYIDQTAGGTHYGVYASVPKPGSYAAYFEGDAYLSGKLKGEDTGDADLKPYVYGTVTAAGAVENGSSTDGFSVTRTATGEYTVQFDQAPGSASDYLVTVTLTDNSDFGLVKVIRRSGDFDIRIIDRNGNAADMSFSFVVYKK